MIDIISVKDLLSRDLSIPEYQRPYKWTSQNVDDLLCDIQNAISDSKKISGYKYRVGTIILNGKEIVDGQQRLITLTLINLFLDAKFSNSISKIRFSESISLKNIDENYQFISEWFLGKSDEEKNAFIDAMTNILEMVVIEVKRVSEAFQVFDSQNFRGKSLDPHDLLKAFHLREMKRSLEDRSMDLNEMKKVVSKWEGYKVDEIRYLFDRILFPIQNWSKSKKTFPFTTKDINAFKGVSEKSEYLFANFIRGAMPNFQLTEQFVSGKNFFDMVDYYLRLLSKIKIEVLNYEKFALIAQWLDPEKELQDIDKKSSGFRYSCNLFYCAMLSYYDKFGNLDERVVRKIFSWAFMLRVDMEHLGYDSVNKYAIGGEDNERYTNHIALFSEIANARTDRDIAKIKIEVIRKGDESKTETWSKLYKNLKKINAR